MSAHHRVRRAHRVAALAAGVAMVVGLGPASYGLDRHAVAHGDDTSGRGVRIVNTETVQVHLDPSARITSRRVYEQLSLTGHGAVELRNPVSTRGLRNVGGFGGVEVAGDDQLVRTSVDGRKSYRLSSQSSAPLPLDVEVHYTLDGRPVDPGEVVGRSGRLGVRFTVTNVTGRDREVTYRDGRGKQVSTTEKVVVPMIGSLTTTAPPGFANVSSPQASIAGDGRGGTRMVFTMALFPPIGAPTVALEYTADIQDGVVPRAELTALPVDPLQRAPFTTVAAAYRNGAQAGRRLTDGAAQIDTNLLRLRDGSAELLRGLVELRDGADRLDRGLGTEAAPGAARVDVGAQQVRAGAARLSGGTGLALAGGRRLATGLARISAGLALLDGSFSSEQARAKVAELRAGVATIVAGVGDPAAGPTTSTLIGALKTLNNAAGLPAARNGAAALRSGLVASHAGVDPAARAVAGFVGTGGGAEQLIGELASLAGRPACAADPACRAGISALASGVARARADLAAVSPGLTRAAALDLALFVGATKLEAGLATAVAGGAALEAKVSQVLRTGLLRLQTGIDVLLVGLAQAAAGVTALDSGAARAYAGSQLLTGGLTRLDDGSARLAEGAGRLRDGTGRLATGLVTAAEGSDRLAAGLRKAAGAAPALPEGAEELSTKGTRRLVEAGESTTRTYAHNVAVIEASAERASTSSMVNGAPKGALGLAAYSYVLEGDAGEGRRNLARALVGLGLLVASGGVLMLRRRLAT